MPSDIIEGFDRAHTVLLIVAAEGHRDAINKKLARSVSRRRLEDGSVVSVFLSWDKAKNQYEVLSKVRAVLPPRTRVWVVPVGGVSDLALKTRLGNNIDVKPEPDSGEFLRNKLDNILFDLGLTWKQDLSKALTQWVGDQIRESDIKDWLKQFDLLDGDSNEWVGLNLLRLLEMWNSHDLLRGLNDTPTLHDETAIICVLKYENGKSADYVSTILKKGLGKVRKGRRIQDFVPMAEQNGPTAQIVVMEDGLFSGIEWAGIIESLLSLGPSSRQKCEPLSNLEEFKKKNVTIHFALATDLGYAYLTSALATLGLTNVRVTYSKNGLRQVLTERGKKYIEGRMLYKNDPDEEPRVIDDIDNNIDPIVFRDPIWGQKKDRAMELCRRVGQDLWKDYLGRKNKSVSDEQLSDRALGSANMAFAFAFSHSVPKATLPLFWCSGKVQRKNGESFDWTPLFPNAE